MANFKRGKCRRNAYRAIRGSETSQRALLGLKPYRVDHERYNYQSREWRIIWPRWYNFTAHNPAWFDRTFHARPLRIKNKRVAKAIVLGKLDPDEALWPLPNKPQIYYW